MSQRSNKKHLFAIKQSEFHYDSLRPKIQINSSIALSEQTFERIDVTAVAVFFNAQIADVVAMRSIAICVFVYGYGLQLQQRAKIQNISKVTKKRQNEDYAGRISGQVHQVFEK